MNELLPAIVLGIVEGVTEFLPISSTGHLILVGDVIQFHGHQEAFFEVFIQLGAILAVVVLYLRTFAALFVPSMAPADDSAFAAWPAVLRMGIACVPAFVFGGIFHKIIKDELFSPKTVAAALIAGAVLMIAAELWRPRIRARLLGEISIAQSFFIGMMQCLALWPGMSRSASTIVGGLLCGVERKAAAQFSFLIAVPVMCGAVAFDLFKNLALLQMSDIPFYLVGFVMSFIAGFVSIRVFLDLLSRFTLIPFAIYRIVLGVAVLLVSS